MAKQVDFWVQNEFRIAGSDPFFLKDTDKLLTKHEKVIVKFDYPLGGEYEFSMKGPVTVESLAAFVQSTYKKIYANPDKYGIWGHCIEDLVLEGATVKRNGVIELGVGS